MSDQRNLLIAIVLSVGILFAFQALFPDPRTTVPPPDLAEEAAGIPAPGSPPPAEAQPLPVGRDAALAGSGRRLPVNPGGEAGRVRGSVALRGLRIDDLELLDYHRAVDAPEEIVLFSPAGSPMPYHAEFGWVNAAGGTARVPGPDSEWAPEEGAELGDGRPVTLAWDNGEGLVFRQTLELDADYMFRITQSVENRTGQAVALHPYGLVRRTGLPELVGFYILHEGPLGVVDGTLEEFDYDDLQDEPAETFDEARGWLGITDKYWLAALVPDPGEPVRMRFASPRSASGERFQVDYLGAAVAAPAGGGASHAARLFAGAKEVHLLDRYRDELGIVLFDRAVDFGWFYVITKPLFHVLSWFSNLFGNVGLAILALTVCIRIVLFPLANKSYVAMSRMKKVQPQMMEIRDRWKDDRQKMQQEVMELYRREKANPLSGCLPILVQIPIFFALYKVLFVTLETRHEPFYGWISDLSAPDPTSIFNLFGLLPFDPPSFLMIGGWPIIMGATMVLQQRLNPAPADPMQARIMMMLPFVFIFIFAAFPAGLIVYWAWNNVLSIAQQWAIMRRVGADS